MIFLKKVLLWGVVAGVLYTLMTHHFIFINKSFKLLKKSRPTLEYTFFSAEGKSNLSIMRIDDLREDGIGDILVQQRRMTEDEMYDLTARLEEEKND